MSSTAVILSVDDIRKLFGNPSNEVWDCMKERRQGALEEMDILNEYGASDKYKRGMAAIIPD
jgi:hypothetical protein